MDAITLGLLGLGAWFFLKGRKTQPAALPAKPASKAASKPASKPAAQPKPAVLPPPSSTAVKWPVLTVQKASAPATDVTPAMRATITDPNQPAQFKTSYAVPQNEEAAVIARERNPGEPSYWTPVKKVTGQEVSAANALLKDWKPGAVSFNGPRTFAGRRLFKAVMQGGKRAVTVWQPKPPFV